MFRKDAKTTTSELLRRAIIGDGMAFTALWDAYIDALKAYLVSVMHVHDVFLIDDICSRSFEKAFRQISSYDMNRSAFSTWLKTIARNTTLDVLESEKRNSRELISLDSANAVDSVFDNIVDSIDTPLDSIIKDETKNRTMESIEALPLLYREVAKKRLIEGLQYKEIAIELDIELNTVRTRIRRAKDLIDKMQDESDI